MSLAISVKQWRMRFLLCFYNPICSAGRLETGLQRLIAAEETARKEPLKTERGTFHRLVCLSTSDCLALILYILYSCVSPVWMNVNGIIPQASVLSFPPTSHCQARFWSSPYVELISNLLNHDDLINQRMSFFFALDMLQFSVFIWEWRALVEAIEKG